MPYDGKAPNHSYFFLQFSSLYMQRINTIWLDFLLSLPFQAFYSRSKRQKLRQKHSDFPVVSTEFLTDIDLGTEMVRFF